MFVVWSVRPLIVLGVGVAGLLSEFVTPAIAHADNEYAGQTYAQAQQAIQQAGGTDTIATVTGDQLPTTQCVVTGSRSAGFLDSSGNSAPGRILLDLDCSAGVGAGNAAAGPQAAQDQRDQQAQQQAESQQNQGDELLQSAVLPPAPKPIP